MKRIVEDKLWFARGPHHKSALSSVIVSAPTWYLARERAGGPDIFSNEIVATDLDPARVEFLDEDSFYCRVREGACSHPRCVLAFRHPGFHLHPIEGRFGDVPASDP